MDTCRGCGASFEAEKGYRYCRSCDPRPSQFVKLLERTIQDLVAERDRLRAALAPFAAVGAVLNPAFKDDAPIYGYNGVLITYGDLRRAAAALGGEEPRDA